MAVVLEINGKRYPLRRTLGRHQRTIRWTQGLYGCKTVPYVQAELIPVHDLDCGINRKRHGYVCTCGASKMYRKLVEQR